MMILILQQLLSPRTRMKEYQRLPKEIGSNTCMRSHQKYSQILRCNLRAAGHFYRRTELDLSRWLGRFCWSNHTMPCSNPSNVWWFQCQMIGHLFGEKRGAKLGGRILEEPL